MFDRDSGHKTFLEDVFENEARMIPGGNWGPASAPWTNVVSLWYSQCKLFQVFCVLHSFFLRVSEMSWTVKCLTAKNCVNNRFFPVSQHGDKIDEKEKIKCPEGWEWTGNWQVDDNRAVDDEGIVKTETLG